MTSSPALAHGSDARSDLVRSFAEAAQGVADDLVETPRGLRLVVENFLERLPANRDPLAKARLRGLLARHELLDSEGGTLSVVEVARLLSITSQAVNKRRLAHKLLALPSTTRALLYPAWQFSDAGSLHGLDVILAALKGHDPWAVARFFLFENDRLDGRRPIDVLRAGDVDAVKQAAESYVLHGAA